MDFWIKPVSVTSYDFIQDVGRSNYYCSCLNVRPRAEHFLATFFLLQNKTDFVVLRFTESAGFEIYIFLKTKINLYEYKIKIYKESCIMLIRDNHNNPTLCLYLSRKLETAVFCLLICINRDLRVWINY